MTYERNSVGLLDLLGDVGGVMEIINLVTAIFGTFFSANFFRASVASSLYIKKETKNKKKKNKNFKHYMKNNFSPIKISTFQLLFDPILALFICSNRCCKHNERIKTLEKTDELFTEELNVNNMLKKIRASYDVLKNIIDENKFYLKYSKNRVIDLNEPS